jgi:hypothetical protein
MLISATKNSCGDCLKSAQQKCESETNKELRDLCLQEACNNFEDIEGGGMPLISDGVDFYQRCQLNEKKDACNVCLKEYFIPATYCHQILDYMSRAFVQYPAVVYIEDIEGSWVIKTLGSVLFVTKFFFNLIFGKEPSPANWWIGWYDENSGCDNNKLAPEDKISVGLICRTFPEFTYEGTDVCKTWCKASADERKNISDFEPTDSDCGNRAIGKALPPQGIISVGAFKARTKCCAALVSDLASYQACTAGEKIITPETEEGAGGGGGGGEETGGGAGGGTSE